MKPCDENFMEISTTELKSKVVKKFYGVTLLEYLSSRFPYHEPPTWRKLILSAKLLVNGAPVPPDFILKKGMIVTYLAQLEEPSVETHIEILYAEETFLVAEKPALLPSHADGNFIKHTFIYQVQQQHPGEKLYLVHRLDREASGLMVVATRAVLQNLAAQFMQGDVAKEYLAVAQGIIGKDNFCVTGAIAHDPDSSISIKRTVVAPGRPGAQHARTEFSVLERLATTTLVKATPKTGRTNQIRVHLNSIGNPIVGDKLYGWSEQEYLDWVHRVKQNKALAADVSLEKPRLLLHAHRLAFRHPLTDKPLTFVSPMPEDMRKFIEKKHDG